MIHYILIFFMGMAVGALLLIRSYEKEAPSSPRLRCPEAYQDDDSQPETAQQQSEAGVNQQQEPSATGNEKVQVNEPALGAKAQWDDAIAKENSAEENSLQAQQEPQLFAEKATAAQSSPAAHVHVTANHASSSEAHLQAAATMQQEAENEEGAAASESAYQSRLQSSKTEHQLTARGSRSALVRAAQRVMGGEKEDILQDALTDDGMAMQAAAESSSELDNGQTAEADLQKTDYSYQSQQKMASSYETSAHTGQKKPTQNEAEKGTQSVAQITTLYLQAPRARPFQGYELLQALLTSGLRFGKRKIFHRYKNMHTNKKIMFSVAQLQRPGTFDIARMGGCRCNGLVFFMAQEVGDYNIIAFEQMLQVAKTLQEELGGDLLDEDHQEFSTAKLFSLRQILREVSSEDDILPVSTSVLNTRDDDEQGAD